MIKYFTAEGLKKLKEELEYLETVKRKEISERIKYAAAFGDLSENAAYDEAKDAQGFVEGRIIELKEIISQAKVVSKKENGRVQVGSTVLVGSNGEENKFKIVAPEEVDIMAGKISYQSPLGSALLNKEKSDKIKVKTPEGDKIYKIIKVE